MPNRYADLLLRAILVCGYFLFVGVFIAQAIAQHGHHQFHAFYQGWINKDGKGCCNDRDCKPIAERDTRVAGGRIEILVRGVGQAKGREEWCQVMAHHYLSRGNAPNWETAHACVTDHYGAQTPCAQFICFQPKPSS